MFNLTQDDLSHTSKELLEYLKDNAPKLKAIGFSVLDPESMYKMGEAEFTISGGRNIDDTVDFIIDPSRKEQLYKELDHIFGIEDRDAYTGEKYGPTGIANPADYMFNDYKDDIIEDDENLAGEPDLDEENRIMQKEDLSKET